METNGRTVWRGARRMAVGAGPAWMVAVMGVLAPATAWGLSQEDLTFHAPLAGSPKPAFARGSAEPQITGQLRFVDDGKRQGLLTGGPDADLAFATEGNLLLDAGTVALWAKPLGWSEDTTLRFYMRVGEDPAAGGPGEGNFLWFYKFFTYPVWLLVQQDYQQREVYLIGPGAGDAGGIYPFQWRDGRWDHIAASWHLNEMRVYVNGHYCGTTQTETPRLLRKLGRYFYIGGPNQQNTADLVLSDFFLFNRPLVEEEIAALAARGAAAIDGKPCRPRLELGCDFFPSLDRLRLRLSVLGRRPGQPGDLRAAVTIESRATHQPVGYDCHTIKLDATRHEMELDTKDLPAGAYRVLAVLLEGTTAASQASAEFQKPARPEWMGNRLGVPTQVPAPWTPLEQKEHGLACWGRTYQWRQALLPTQITTQSEPILARPIGLKAVVDGKAVELGPAVPQWKITPLKAEMTAAAPLGPLEVRADAWMEFDGFVWTQLTVSGSATATLERLVLEIACRPAMGSLWHANIGPGHASGEVRRLHMAIRSSPYAWIGSAVGGLQWCADRPHAWPVARQDRQVELEPTPTETLFRVTLVEGQRSMAEPFQAAFGLQATPVRPLPKGWRQLEPLNCWWTQWSIQSANQRSGPAGYPVPSPEGRWRESLADMTRLGEGKPPFPYLCLGLLWRGTPVYATFRSEWVTGNAAPPPLEATADEWAAAGVCHEAQSFVDWRLWRIHKTFSENPDLVKGIRGLYLDVTQAPICGNVAHGCGRRAADGTLVKRYGLLGMREFQKRLYCLLQQHWPHLLIINHESGSWHMSQLAFAHIMVDGECTFHLPPLTIEKMNYYDLLKLADWRSEYMGHPYGLVPVFLPQPSRRVHGDSKLWAHVIDTTGIPAAQHVVGMLLVHDIVPWPAYMNPEPFVRLRKMKDAFGWDDALQFAGYWTTPIPLVSDVQPVVASVYRRPGKALVVIMNDSDKPARVRLTVDAKALGLASVKELVDAYAAPTFEYENIDVPTYVATQQQRLVKHPSAGQAITIPVGAQGAEVVVPARNFRALEAR